MREFLWMDPSSNWCHWSSYLCMSWLFFVITHFSDFSFSFLVVVGEVGKCYSLAGRFNLLCKLCYIQWGHIEECVIYLLREISFSIALKMPIVSLFKKSMSAGCPFNVFKSLHIFGSFLICAPRLRMSELFILWEFLWMDSSSNRWWLDNLNISYFFLRKLDGEEIVYSVHT